MIKVSLADIEKAAKTRAYSRLREQLNIRDAELVDALLNGKPLPIQEGR